MFTGIVQELGTVVKLERSPGLIRVTVAAAKTAARVQRLESLAVNGVCLSAVSVRPPTITFEVIRETQRLTTLGSLRRGDRINVEPSLLLTDRLNGHLVMGHVDGMGTVVTRHQRPSELVIELRVGAALRRCVVPKGPVTIDGVSLTVGGAPSASTFTVHLIPETLRQTTLRALQVGDRANIEVDYLAKLAWQFLQRPGTLARMRG